MTQSEQGENSDRITSEAAGFEPENREKLSAFVICFNEEADIAACLSSIAFCDEIIVIDSFSTDRTVEIAEQYGAKVISRAWPGYKAQKQFGLDSCSHDWVLNIDADERVDETLKASLLSELSWKRKLNQGLAEPRDEEPLGYSVSRIVYFLGRWWSKGGWYPEYRVRFFYKPNVIWGGVDPHEKPEVDGPIDTLPGALQHFTYRDLSEQLERLKAHASIAAEEEVKRGRKFKKRSVFLNPLSRIWKFYFAKGGFREGFAGVVVAGMEGFYTFFKYARVWELTCVESDQTLRQKLSSTPDDSEPTPRSVNDA